MKTENFHSKNFSKVHKISNTEKDKFRRIFLGRIFQSSTIIIRVEVESLNLFQKSLWRRNSFCANFKNFWGIQIFPTPSLKRIESIKFYGNISRELKKTLAQFFNFVREILSLQNIFFYSTKFLCGEKV